MVGFGRVWKDKGIGIKALGSVITWAAQVKASSIMLLLANVCSLSLMYLKFTTQIY